jgi:signal transduction histidine kinase
MKPRQHPRLRLAGLIGRANTGRLALHRWLQANTLAPAWMPARLRLPLLGYVLALLLTLLVTTLEVVAVRFFPPVEHISGIFVFLLILFIGIQWGAGPSLLATLLGSFLLYYLVYPPFFEINHKQFMEMLQGGLVLFGGLFITQTISTHASQRRTAQQRSAETEQAQLRLQAVLETQLALVEALVQTSDVPPPLQTGGESASGPLNSAPAQEVVARRLAEVTCYALGCHQVHLFSYEPSTNAGTLLAAVNRISSAECQGWPTPPHAPLTAWLDASLLARLSAGEVVQVDPSQPVQPPAAHSPWAFRLLLVPILRGSTLLGLLALDAPWMTPQIPAHLLALVRVIAKLGALVIERGQLLHERAAAQDEVLTLHEAKRKLEVFLGIASHELKTPLTSLRLGIISGQRHLARVTAEQPGASQTPADGILNGTALAGLEEDLQIISQQSRRLERLVKELLDSSRIEAGHLELARQPTDLTAMLREAIEEQRLLTPTRLLLLHPLPSAPVPVLADRERIKQVISNYLSNALKYSAEDRPVEVGIQIEEEQAHVWVQDSGPGIPAELHHRLWERFYRAPGIEVQSGSGVGLGLGLYLSRVLIEQHQGQVGVESTPGQGARFWFTLPLSSAAPRL